MINGAVKVDQLGFFGDTTSQLEQLILHCLSSVRQTALHIY